MSKVPFHLLSLSLGVVAGQLVADLIAPRFLTWYNMPGAGSAMCNCVEVVNSTATSMVQAHLAGSAVGGLLFFAGGLTLRWGKGTKASTAA